MKALKDLIARLFHRRDLSWEEEIAAARHENHFGLLARYKGA